MRVIANRWDKKLLSLSWPQVERFLGRTAVSFIPDDSRAVVNSINLGQPLVEKFPAAPISVEIKRLAQILTGKPIAGANPLASKAAELNGAAKPSSPDAKSWKLRLGAVFSRG